MENDDLIKKAEELRTYMWSISRTLNRLQADCRQGECDLTTQEIKAVEFLGGFGPVKMKDLAEHLMLAVSSTTTLVDNLEAKDVVRRIRSSEDRRVIFLELTEAGAQDFERASQSYLDFCIDMLNTLDEDDQDKLVELFRKMNKAR